MNAYAKVNHRNPELFDIVAAASIPIFHTFKAPVLVNTVNAIFGKVRHLNSQLFDNVATAANPINYTFRAQN